MSFTRTRDELSIVCELDLIPADVQCERDWQAVRVEGILDFALTGILNTLTEPLAREKISVFAISTFDTDYLLLKSETLDRGLAALAAGGHEIV